jgi:hypothetical protein
VRLPRPADVEEGRAALQEALDAWQQGKASEDLQQRTPPIYVNDTDWRAGQSLVRYRLKNGNEYHGAQLRCSVLLSLRTKGGEQREKTVTYLIDTHPALVIVRGDM